MSDKLRAVLVGDTLTYNLTPEQALAVGINPAVYVGEPGKSPYIGEDGFWYVYDNETQEWKKTDTEAQGPQGNVGPQGPVGPKGTTDWNELTNKPEFADVATSGDYIDLLNAPQPMTTEEIMAILTDDAALDNLIPDMLRGGGI